MANNASARKRIRQTKVRTERNRVLKSRLKTFRKQVLASIEEGDTTKIQESYNRYASAADSAVKKNVIHKNAAGRLKSRMAKRMAAAAS